MIFRLHLQLPLKLRKKDKKHILWFNIFYPCQIRSILSSPGSDGRRSKMWPKEAFRVSCKTKITDLSSSLKVSCCHVIAPWRPVSTGQGDNPRESVLNTFLWTLADSSDNPIIEPSPLNVSIAFNT